MEQPSPSISIVVPTLNEAENLPQLAARIDAALRPTGRAYEVVIVDDGSRDGTPDVVAKLAAQYPLRLIVRQQPEDGLGGAVLRGFAEARGDLLVVMDADLQHPPEKLPELIAAVDGGAEFALGSRHTKGGSIATKWSFARRVNSVVATWLARPFVAGGVSDPMSGFFAIPRRVFERGRYLTPLGYKIGLELMCKCRVAGVTEVPIHFGERAAGQSKLSVREQFRYLEHLSRLYDFCYPRLSPISKFLIVTTLSWLVGLAVFLLMAHFQRPAWAATTLAYGGVLLTTGVFHYRYVKTQRRFLPRPTPWRDFFYSCFVEWSVCYIAAWYLHNRLANRTFAEMFFIPFVAALAARYVLRKELLLDVRGLRQDAEPRAREIGAASSTKSEAAPSPDAQEARR